jgi:signal transduction histidine kinase
MVIAVILGLQVLYSLAALWTPMRSVWPFAFADIVTVSVSAVLVGLEPTSVHLLLAADVLALSLVLDTRFARASVLLGAVAVAVIYVVQPWAPFVDVSTETVDKAQLASGLVGLAVATWVMFILVREVQSASATQDARIEQERNKAEFQARFLAMVSHELRTPLTAIRGFASVLQDGIDTLETAELTEFVDAIAGQSEHLARVVDDVLVTLKLDTGALAANTEPVDVVELFSFVANLVDSSAKIIVFDAGDVAEILADRDRVIQVLRNLVENAVKYGGSRIDVIARRAGTRIELAVSDDGPGIPEDAIDTVFGDYVQLSGSSSSIADGLGLGLAICRRLVEAMGGTVSAENRAEGGARFTVSMPS